MGYFPIEPMSILFWSCLLFIVYTYVGYPLLLFFWSRLFPRPVNKRRPDSWPSVSIIIAAKNEEGTIGPRLKNLLGCRYPMDRLQIIVVSDGSTDGTIDAVQAVIDSPQEKKEVQVVLQKLDQSVGKPTALNAGLLVAKGECIVFTDSRQRFEEDAITQLISNFSDPSVGCVSGELFFVEHENSTVAEEMGLYWKIEKLVRKLESTIGSVAGATGSIYAIRKELFQPMKPQLLLDDVFTPMQIVLNGYRCVFDPVARAYDIPSTDDTQEWLRKVRTLAGCWQLLTLLPSLANPMKNPIWFRFFSHKIFRLLVPFALFLLFVASFFPEGGFYQLAIWGQIVLYLTACLGWLIPKTRKNKMINLAFFFVMLNGAALSGFYFWAAGKCQGVWK